jgi:hypothetical protein
MSVPGVCDIDYAAVGGQAIRVATHM